MINVNKSAVSDINDRLKSKPDQMLPNWQSELTPEEQARLLAIKAEQRALSHERRQIYDRARKRLLRA